MSWAPDALNALERAEIEVIAYLPDTKLMPLIDAVEDHGESAEGHDGFETVLVTREEEAVGVVVGAWLGGKRGALLCQSSGLANAFNAFASLAVPARIPFLTITTRRGDLGEFNLAQVPAGYGLPDMLDELGVRNHCIDEPAHVGDRVRMAAETAFATETPYAVLLESTVTGYKEESQQS